MKYVVYLSPSTQEKNIGVGEYKTEEFRMNQVADILQKKLESSGRYIVYRNNPLMTLDEIIFESNKILPNVHVALHSNAGLASGPEVFIYSPRIKVEKLAKYIYAEILKIYYNPIGGRGVKANPNLKELRLTKAPTVIVEYGFHDNPKDAEWIIQNEDKLAEATFKSINEYFGIKI